MFDQPIVERKSSSPLATSLLVLSAVFLLTASVFVGAQIKGLTVSGSTPTDSAQTLESQQKKAIRDARSILTNEDR